MVLLIWGLVSAAVVGQLIAYVIRKLDEAQTLAEKRYSMIWDE